MTTLDTIDKPLTADEYTTLAQADDAAGNAAWNQGRIKRAIWLWQSAARWEQYARAVREAV